MKNKLNILYVNMSRNLWGGNEVYVNALANNMSVRGHKIIVACSNESLLPANLSSKEIEVVQLTLRNSGDIAAILKMKRIIKQYGIDIIHGNWGKELWPVTLAGKGSNAKSVFTRHMMQHFKNISRWLINNWLDRLIVPSQAVFDSMTGIGIEKNKMRLVYNGVDSNTFCPGLNSDQFRKEYNIPTDKMLVGIVSIIPNPHGKGHFTLVESIPKVLKSFADCCWVIMGDGPVKSRLEEFAKKNGVYNKIIFTGKIEKDKVPYAMNMLDIFVLPSYQQEACPFVVMEAMACGKPVLAGDIGGNKELVEHNVTGFLFPSQDADKLAEYTIKLLSDVNLKNQMGARARNKVEQKFSYNTMVQETEKAYLELINN